MINYSPKDASMDENGFGIFINETGGEEPVHTHSFIEFVYLLGGRGTQTIGGRSFEVTKGDLLFIDRGRSHCFSAPEGMTYVNIALEPTFISRDLSNFADTGDILSVFLYGDVRRKLQIDRPLFRFHGPDLLEMDRVVTAMNEEFRARRPGYEKIIASYLNIFFLMILRALQTVENDGLLGSIRTSMTEIADYIGRNSASRISLEEIAAKCFYSPAYFSRLFKQQFGVNFTAYLQEKRMDTAVRLLSNPACSIGEVSAAVGYSDRKDFYRAFKKAFGTTPNEFRKARKSAGAEPEHESKVPDTGQAPNPDGTGE